MIQGFLSASSIQPPIPQTKVISLSGLTNRHRRYLKKKRVEKTSQSCAICIEKYTPGEVVLQLPCKHIFHNNRCIKDWFLMDARCPVCRFDVKQFCVQKERQEQEGGEQTN